MEAALAQQSGQAEQAIVPAVTSRYSGSRGAIIEHLAKTLPLNDFNLPKFIYRPDLIAENNKDDHDVLNAAVIPISYEEGFPTLPNNAVFWAQFEFEPVQAYQMFERYLTQPSEFGVRQFQLLASEEAPLSLLREYFDTFYWRFRAKAHDLFIAAVNTKLREQRVMQVEDTHFLTAERLLKRVLTYFENDDPEKDFTQDLNPKTAADLLKTLVQMQRISLGLPAHGASAGTPSDTPPNASVEVILRTLAKQSADSSGAPLIDGKTGLDVLLEDDDTADMAQELIIRMSSGKHVQIEKQNE